MVLFGPEKGQTMVAVCGSVRIEATPEKKKTALKGLDNSLAIAFVRPLQGRFEEVGLPPDPVGLRATATVVFPRRGKEAGDVLRDGQ